MKKILVLASTFPRWKNDTTPPFVLELEKRLANDFNLFVLAPHFSGAKKKETIENLYVTRFQYFWPANLQKLCYGGGIMPNLKKNKLLYIQAITLLFFEFIAAIKIIKKKKIHLIHAHWIIPQGVIAVLIKKLFGIPYIVTTHGGDIYGLQNSIMKYIKKAVLENAKQITVVSTAIKEEILTTINSKLNITVISMGVDAKLFNPDKYDETLKKKYNIQGPFLLFVGRLADKKGVEYLLKAMPQIVKEFPKTKLLIVGEGTIEEKLQKLSHKLNLAENVFFVGALPNTELPKYYGTADIFIGPSIKTHDGDTEGLGLTFVEASFAGCIPIGTDIGGISDVIKDNESGFLINEKDPQSIAHLVIKLLKNDKLRNTIKKNSRDLTIKQFDWHVITQKYNTIYRGN